MTSHCHFTARVRVEARRDPNEVGAYRRRTGQVPTGNVSP